MSCWEGLLATAFCSDQKCDRSLACEKYFAKALFVIGEFGWNDYGFMLLSGRSVDEIRSHTPQIVEMISAATEVCIRRVLINLARSVQQLIKEGGATVVVSGLTPIGCATGNLVLFGSQNEADYEPDTGCLKDLNSLSRDHNLQLRRALTRLHYRHPGARITYADFYTPIVNFVVTPQRFGFNGTEGGLRWCCCGGGGGRYNFHVTALCGMPGVSACGEMIVLDGSAHAEEAAGRRDVVVVLAACATTAELPSNPAPWKCILVRHA
jgi:hypothetical protein